MRSRVDLNCNEKQKESEAWYTCTHVYLHEHPHTNTHRENNVFFIWTVSWRLSSLKTRSHRQGNGAKTPAVTLHKQSEALASVSFLSPSLQSLFTLLRGHDRWGR